MTGEGDGDVTGEGDGDVTGEGDGDVTREGDSDVTGEGDESEEWEMSDVPCTWVACNSNNISSSQVTVHFFKISFKRSNITNHKVET